MKTLTELDREVLNATADDWENLEQIFSLIRNHSDNTVVNGRPEALAAIADSIHQLCLDGHFTARTEMGAIVTDFSDRSFVWKCWFAMTTTGRQAWSADNA